MSRIGKQPIIIPAGVTVIVNGRNITVKGALGEMSFECRPEIKIEYAENTVKVSVVLETHESMALWGTTRALIANMVQGVTKGYEKRLELIGVGYRAKQMGPDGVSVNAGYSHPVEFKAPKGVTIEVPDNTTIIIKGYDKNLVGLAAANIRKIRKPEPYKGKGIKYSDEIVRRKAGKTSK